MSPNSNATPKAYKGSCHCKRFSFDFEQPVITKATVCNCSICTQRAYVYIIFDIAKFKWTSESDDNLSKYQFGKKQWKHEFCPTCGSALVIRGDGTNGKILVNLRSVEEIDINALEIEYYDGKSVPIVD